MTEHRDEEQNDERIEDLDVPESESEEVKGGSLNFSKIEYSQKFQKVDIASKVRPPGNLGSFGDGSV